MNKMNIGMNLIPLFLLAIVISGYSGLDLKTPGAHPSFTQSLPTVLSVSPANGTTLACSNSEVITVSFNSAMNPATINNSTFTVIGAGGSSVVGTVNYVASSHT